MAYNDAVEKFRDDEYPMMKGKTYLDHGGTTIYARSLIECFSEKMISNLYGNPHSASDPAQLSGFVVDSVRENALRFLGADPEHFDLIFTANATAAIKLVSESFRDLAAASSTSGTFWYGYHKDAHTSIVGVREHTDGNHHCFRSDGEVEDWLNGSWSARPKQSNEGNIGLFAYPGQSNMTGRRLPLSWIGRLRRSCQPSHQNTYSLLDAAALATTTQLDFSDLSSAPDFTSLSFYKIFGFPDLGALIVRKNSGHILLWRKYFGGGTVSSLTVFHEATYRRKEDTLHDGLEDGTLPFHSIIALGCAIDVHKTLYGSMKSISKHTSFLSHRLYTGLSSLLHFNGRPVCAIYHEGSTTTQPYTDPNTQGATVAFSIVRADGSYVGHSTVEQLANEKKIYIRAGGLCNAGGIASYLRVEPWQFKRAWSSGYRCGDGDGTIEVINGTPMGVVRASLGAMSTISDVNTFLAFLSETFTERAAPAVAIPQTAPHNAVQPRGVDSEQRPQVDHDFGGEWHKNDITFVSGDEGRMDTPSSSLCSARSPLLPGDLAAVPNLRGAWLVADIEGQLYTHTPGYHRDNCAIEAQTTATGGGSADPAELSLRDLRLEEIGYKGWDIKVRSVVQV